MNKVKKAALGFIVAGLLMATGNTVYANPIYVTSEPVSEPVPVSEMWSAPPNFMMNPIFFAVWIVIVIIIVAIIVARIIKKKK